MGILNATPDSFYEKSRFLNQDALLNHAEKMLREGAGILDIGGQSTRPGAPQVGITEECERVIPAIKAVSSRFPEAILSVDTYHARVAREAVDAGASMVNDISGGNLDPDMIPTVATLRVPYVCMHSKGDPKTMQAQASYNDLAGELLDYFIAKRQQCLVAGITDLIIDPGFGFAKNSSHNFELLKQLPVFRMIGCPLLLGLSRKSTIYKTLGIGPEEALNGSTVLNTVGLLYGADILRVHDVREAKQAVKLVAHVR